MLALGRFDEALIEFRDLLKFANHPVDSRIRYARLLIGRNLRSSPDQKPDWKEVKDQLDLAARELDELAKKDANDPARKDPKAADLSHFQVQVALLQLDVQLLEDPKQTEKVRSALEKKADEGRGPVEFSLGLATLQGREKKGAEALQTLAKAEKNLAEGADSRTKQAQRADLHLARLPHLVGLPEAEARRALAEEEKIASDWTDDNRRRLLGGLADAYVRVGASEEAVRLWQQLAKEQPENLSPRLLLLNQAVKDKKDAKIKELLGDLRRIEGDLGTFWRYEEAAQLARQAVAESKEKLTDRAKTRLGEARDYLDQAGKRRPSWYRVPALQGEIADLEGNAPLATERYQQAFALETAAHSSSAGWCGT